MTLVPASNKPTHSFSASTSSPPPLSSSSSTMNDYCKDEKTPSCYSHPKEVFVGVCPRCLNEKLLILAAKQGLDSQQKHPSRKSAQSYSSHSRRIWGVGPHLHKKLSLRFTKIFAFGSLLHCWKSQATHDDVPDICTSLDDSFISIKFEVNGVATWDKGKGSKVAFEKCNDLQHTNNSAIEGGKKGVRGNPNPGKRVNQVLKLLRWWGSSKKKGSEETRKVGRTKKGKSPCLRSRRRRRRRTSKE